ncbi:hypothetical protein BRAO375_860027 [Bradyrhizobium sp. ORS 375]|nr:hypothetical protein BRAO375_860027 [Bradyrhizobium sp. ORS 375]
MVRAEEPAAAQVLEPVALVLAVLVQVRVVLARGRVERPAVQAAARVRAAPVAAAD